MDLSNLKKGLFGYNKLAVANYIASLDSEYSAKIQELQKQSSETKETLHGQMESLRSEYDEKIRELREQVEKLRQERDDLRSSNDTIADTLIAAQEYAVELKARSDQRDKERDEEHLRVLEGQYGKVQDFSGKIHGLLEQVNEILQDVAGNLEKKEEKLNAADEEIVQEQQNVFAQVQSGSLAQDSFAQEECAEPTSEETGSEEMTSEETSEDVQDAGKEEANDISYRGFTSW